MLTGVAITIASIISLFVLMYIRKYLILAIGPSDAGLWESVLRISISYFTIIGTAISTYVLPRFSEMTNRVIIIKEFTKIYLSIIPFVVIGFILIYLLRDIILQTLYTKEFLGASQLILPQLISDLFKVSSILFSYLLLARGNIKIYFIIEILFSLSFLLLSIALINKIGIAGPIYAAGISYFIYNILIISFIKKIKLYTEI